MHSTQTYREVTSVVLDSFRSDETANGEPCGAVGLIALHDRVAPCHWHVVDHPLVHVALMDPLAKKLQLALIVFVLEVRLLAK